MTDDDPGLPPRPRPTLSTFFADLAQGLVRDLFRLVAAAGIGTAIGAGVCLYYGLPLVLSLLGGLIVLGLAALLLSDL
ncbi:MAG: hypothetical protein H6871_05245 [Methylobacteriaceae bacterium]|nr:hypothetical protein [Methylobacteriaceae bacterium]MCC0002418.1 hypothetical protein [Methylobacteriaceae bacterium]MCC2102202.1 hypothetical protein [Hyphomicrobiales bacterium]MCO5086611.1 hypothetical protein [Methylobacteriaceae bacterium]